MELHAVSGQVAVLGAHDQPVLGPCGQLERRWKRRLDDERVIPTRLERYGEACEDAPPLVEHERSLDVDGLGAIHGPSRSDTECLVTEEPAQDRRTGGE